MTAFHATVAAACRAGAPLLAVVALVMAAATGPAGAQGVWQRNGKPVTDQPNAAASGAFGVMQIVTDDPDRLLADWRIPTPGVVVRETTRTPRGRPIATFLVFKGCRADPAGNCNVTADFEVFDPSGRPSGQSRPAEIWVGHPPAPGNNLQLSASSFGITFDDGDPSGAYRVRATVTDHIAGITLRTEQVLTLLEK